MSYQEQITKHVDALTIDCLNEPLRIFVRGLLRSLGFDDHAIIDQEDKGHFQLCIYGNKDKRIKKAADILTKIEIPNITVKYRVLKPADWLTRWKDNWKPSALTKHIDVVPVWHQDKYRVKKNRSFILMDTLLSFGTGLHETTQIVSQMIEDQKGKFESFLDIGTGTGVLAMVAIIHGAKNVVAVDIGDLSIDAAKSNLKLNKMKAKVGLADIRKYKDSVKYDFVAANLITHDLIKYRKRIVSLVKKGGLLAVSGISLGRLAELEKGFSDLRLKKIQVVKRKEWAGILYQG